MSAFISDLTHLDACDAGIKFVTQFDTPQAAWEACDDPSFMQWYLGKVGRSSEINSAYRQYRSAKDEAYSQYRAAKDEAWRQYYAAGDPAWRQYYAALDEARRQCDAVVAEAGRQYAKDIRKIIPKIPRLSND